MSPRPSGHVGFPRVALPSGVSRRGGEIPGSAGLQQRGGSQALLWARGPPVAPRPAGSRGVPSERAQDPGGNTHALSRFVQKVVVGHLPLSSSKPLPVGRTELQQLPSEVLICAEVI